MTNFIWKNYNWFSESLHQPGEDMKAEAKRFSISLTQDLSERLQEAKAEYYSQVSQKKMLADLIEKGLEAVKKNKREDSK